MPEHFGATDIAIANAAFELLGDGPMLLRELVELMLSDANAHPELSSIADQMSVDDAIVLIGDTLMDLDEFWQIDPHDTYENLPDEPIARCDVMLHGRTFTTRVSADDLATGSLEIGPNLLAVDWVLGRSSFTVNSQPCDRRYDSDSGRMDLHRSGDWLADYAVGDLLAVSWDRHANDVGVAPAPPQLDDATAATAAFVEFAEGHDEQTAFEITRPLMDLLVRDAAAFASASPPIVELMAAAGYPNEPGSDWFGREGVESHSAGSLTHRAAIDDIADEFDLEPCCRASLLLTIDAFDAFFRHWVAAQRDDNSSEPDSVDYRLIAQNLAHHDVADAFAQWRYRMGSVTDDATNEFLQAIAATRRADAAAAHYLLGVMAEETRDFARAEAAYVTALGLNGGYTTPHRNLALIAFDRGDDSTARRHFQAYGFPPNAPIFELFPDDDAPFEPVGRNEPCPCGSGRKYKACHQRSGAAKQTERDPWRELERKEVLFRAQLGADNPIMELATIAANGDSDRLEALLDDLFIEDMARFEAGGMAEFIDARGSLLPPRERELADKLTTAKRDLYEVVAVDTGQSLTLRNVTNGAQVQVQEHTGSLGRTPGDYLLGRVLDHDGVVAMFGHAILVPMRGRSSLIEVLDNTGHGVAEYGYELAWWYGALTAPPRMTTSDGEDFVMCTAELQVHAALADVAAFLETFADPDGDGKQFTVYADTPSAVAPAAGRSISASISIAAGSASSSVADATTTVMVETLAEARLENVIDRLREFADLDVISSEATPFEMPTGGGEHGRINMAEMQDAVDGIDSFGGRVDVAELGEQISADFETRWIDESVPALGGATPRQAANDPTRRADLIRLLDGIPPLAPGDFGMDANRLRAVLGLDQSDT